MAKSEEKLQALQMRREGESIKEIAKKLGVSRASASVWVRDIELSKEQREYLTNRQIATGHKGRMMGTEINRAKKRVRIEIAEREAKDMFEGLDKEQLFLIGLGLYWGEGSKSIKHQSLVITNSDLNVMHLMVRWFKECFGIDQKRFQPRIFISDLHRDREEILIHYWSEKLGIPRDQFRRTIFLNKGRKLYENRDVYYGVLALRIAKGIDIRYKILAYIERIGHVVAQAGVVQELERGTHKP